MTTRDVACFANEEPPTLIRRRPPTLEKRAGARLPIEMDVAVEGAAHRFQALTGDLSSGGMFVVTHRALPVGANVALAFTLPNGTSLEVLGLVQWQTSGGDAADGVARSPGLGVAFFCLEPDVKAVLEKFCSVREPLYYSSHASGEFARAIQ